MPLDAISIVPTRRTRDPEDVSLDWQIDAFKFSMPVIGAPMDSVMSPATAIQLGQLGGMGVLNLEGLWTRYEDPQRSEERRVGKEGSSQRWRGRDTARRTSRAATRPQ